MKSAIYTGSVVHARVSPKKHAFSYRVYMMYLDLFELDEVIARSRLLSKDRLSPLQFSRKDFHGDPSKPVIDEVYKTVEAKSGIRLDGPVRVLSNWRCFGLNFNPISVYYCFDKRGETLQAVVAEVTNTPWLEREAYVLAVDEAGRESLCTKFDKVFTVSPFNPLNMKYVWTSSCPEQSVKVGVKNYREDTLVFKAFLQLERIELTRANVHKTIATFPFITLKVIAAIYWQALKLFVKGVPFLGKDKVQV